MGVWYDINRLVSIMPAATNLAVKYIGKMTDHILCPFMTDSLVIEDENDQTWFKQLKTLHHSCYSYRGNKKSYKWEQKDAIWLYRFEEKLFPIKSDKLTIQVSNEDVIQNEGFIAVKHDSYSATFEGFKLINLDPDQFEIKFWQIIEFDEELKSKPNLKNPKVFDKLMDHYNDCFLFVPTQKVKISDPFLKNIQQITKSGYTYRPFPASKVFNELGGLRNEYTFSVSEEIDEKLLKQEIHKAPSNSMFKFYFEKDFDINTNITKSCFEFILTLNLLELRIYNMILTEFIYNSVLDFLKANKKLRDLELIVNSRDKCHEILEAVQDNYMIKTIFIKSKTPVLKGTIKLAESIRASHICTQILLTTSDVRFSLTKVTVGETFYPD